VKNKELATKVKAILAEEKRHLLLCTRLVLDDTVLKIRNESEVFLFYLLMGSLSLYDVRGSSFCPAPVVYLSSS
jgi:hypothetical protein